MIVTGYLIPTSHIPGHIKTIDRTTVYSSEKLSDCIIGKMKSCFLQSPRAYILSGSKESGTFAIHDPEDKPGDNNRAPSMIGFCQCTGKSSLRNLLWSNKIENALQRIIFYKKSHRTAKIIYTDPRKRLCAGTDGGGKLHVQGPEHLFHCSAVRRKYKSETCYDQTGLWRTTAGLLLPGIAKIGQKAFSACIGIFIKSSRRRIISHGRSRYHQSGFLTACSQSANNTLRYPYTAII